MVENKKPGIGISIALWVLAFLLTATMALYQRLTGPTYAIRDSEIIKGKAIKYVFNRSYTEFKAQPITITAPDPEVKAFLNFKRYKTDDDWFEIEMKRDFNNNEQLTASIPGQPAAGKMEYIVRVSIGGENILLHEGKSVVTRFKGEVPFAFLFTHVILMFFSIFFSLRTGMEVLRKNGNYMWMVNASLIITFIGGMILGPIVQQYAFGDLWTGFPFGFDLTDNKVLVAVLCWFIAFFLKKKSRWWVILAAAIMIVIYLIPHSVLGSELDYETGKMRNKYGVILKNSGVNGQLTALSLKKDNNAFYYWHKKCSF